MASQRQPNFLFIITDQHRADHLGCYGNPIVRTPNIDGIAARGLAFDRFYVASPICMPNRATIMTGKMPSANGVPTNGLPLPVESTTFVDLLRAEGYQTALVGKSHLQNMVPTHVEDWNYPPPRPGKPPPQALSESLKRKITGPEYEIERCDLWIADPHREAMTPFYGFDHVRFANMHGDRVQGHYTAWLAQRTNDPDGLRGPDNALDRGAITAPQAWRTRMPEELYPTRYVQEMGVEMLETFAEQPDRPFFMQYSFPDPHHPFTPPGKYWDMYDPDAMPVPDSHPSSPGAKHTDPSTFWKRFHQDFEEGRAKREHVHPYACTVREAQETIALTYGMITMIDDAIGALLKRLDELDMADNTIVIFTADHGDMMGDHGLMLKHGFAYENLIRIPFIWSDPQGGPGGRTDLLAGSIDIGATVLGRIGLAPPNGSQGHDLMPAVQDGSAPLREAMLVEEDQLPINANLDGYMRMRTLVTGRYRLTVWEDDPLGEMFDREADPLELSNLWNDPGSQDLKKELFELMLREQLHHQDRGPRAVYCA